MSLPVHIQEICDALTRRDGHLTAFEIDRAENGPESGWHEPEPLINAHPDRMKVCPICWTSKPIAEFLYDSRVLRTVIVYDREEGRSFAHPCADVAEVCAGCSQ